MLARLSSVVQGRSPASVQWPTVDRLSRFEDHRWVGDKRSQVVHDIDNCTSPDIIHELVEAETYLCFGPDTSVEARNRGYKVCRVCEGVRRAARVDGDGATDDD